MIFPSSSSPSSEVEESDAESRIKGAANFIPGIFVNLCSSENEDISEYSSEYRNENTIKHPRYFDSVKPPAVERTNEPPIVVTRSTENCKSCGLSGHLQNECSLKWRHYKLKTVLSKPILLSVSETLNKWCYHCAQQGHFGDDCMRKRFKSQFTAFHTPLFSLLSKASYSENITQSKTPKASHSKGKLPNMNKINSSNSNKTKLIHKQPTPTKRPKLS